MVIIAISARICPVWQYIALIMIISDKNRLYIALCGVIIVSVYMYASYILNSYSGYYSNVILNI